MTGVTLSGFKYEIDDEAMDDMELLEALAEIDDDGKFWRASKILDILFGKKQKDAYYGHLRAEDGRVKVTKVMEDLGGILNEDGDVKN